MVSAATPPTPVVRRRRPVNARRKLLFVSLLVFGLLLCAELAARVWLVRERHLSFWRPGRIAASFYLELGAALDEPMAPDDSPLDVLVLAGSAFYPYYGNPGDHLVSALRRRLPRLISVQNMGQPGHMSRDNLIKMRWLADRPWDAVVLYDGINDVRPNNAPPWVFRPDYGHLVWFAKVNRMAPGPGLGDGLALRPGIGGLGYLVWWLRTGRHLIPTIYDVPPSQWLDYGADLRSADCLEANYREIARICAEREIPLIISTYASHLDPGYSRPALEESRKAIAEQRPWVSPMGYDRPPYADYAQPLEIWGRPDHVLRGIAEHNRRALKVAAEVGAESADVAGAMPAASSYYIDVCHYSPRGVIILTDTIAAAVVRAITPGEFKRTDSRVKPSGR